MPACAPLRLLSSAPGEGIEMPLLPPTDPYPTIDKYAYCRWDPQRTRRRATPNIPSPYEQLMVLCRLDGERDDDGDL